MDFLIINIPNFLWKIIRYEDNQNKNDNVVENINESLINLRNYINSKEIPEREKKKKQSILLKKILDFNKRQR